MSTKDYTRLDPDAPSRNLIIDSETLITLPESILRKSGGFFQAMLDRKHQFTELEMTTIEIQNEIHPDLQGSDWILYFDVVAEIIQLESIPPENLRTILLISDYFQNLKLTNTLKTFLEKKISEEPLQEYLDNWVYYFLIYVSFDPGSPGAVNRLFEHLKDRLLSYESKDFLLLLSCCSDMLGLVDGQGTIADDLYEFLKFYRIWWIAARTQFLEELSSIPFDTNQGQDQNKSENKDSNNESEESEESETALVERKPQQVKKLAQSLLIDPFSLKEALSYNSDSIQSNHELIKNTILFDNFLTNQPTIIDEEDFEERWNDLTRGLLEGINWTGVVLAGGSVNKLLNPKVKTFGPQTDMDLFLLGDPDIQRQKLQELLTWFLLRYTDDLYIGFQRSLVYLWVRGIPRTIQIILSKANSIFEVLSRFDLSHCQMAFDGNLFRLTPGALTCLLTQTTEQVTESYNPAFYRLFKAQKLGYSLSINKNLANRYNKYIESAENQVKMSEKRLYNYFFPYTKSFKNKNQWELKRHYGVKQVWTGEEIRISNILDSLQYSSDFRRSYEDSESETPIVLRSAKHIDWGQFTLSESPRRYSNGLEALGIKYLDKCLTWNLPKMKIMFVNLPLRFDPRFGGSSGSSDDSEANNFREIILRIPEEYLDTFQEFDENVFDKFFERAAEIYKKNSSRYKRRFQNRELAKDLYSGLVKTLRDREGIEIRDYTIKLKVNSQTQIVNAVTGEIAKDATVLDNLRGCDIKARIRFKCIWIMSSMNVIAFQPEKITYYPTSTQLQQVLIES